MMKAEGWRHVYAHWHYFRHGSSLCGKFSVSIIGGGEPRRTWKKTLTVEEQNQQVCQECLEKL